MNLTQIIIILIAAATIFGGLGVIVHFGFGGYKALEFRNKPELRNVLEGIISFFKAFKA